VTVLGHGQGESGVGAFDGAVEHGLTADGAAGGVVVVAEELAAQGGTAAAVALGVDVAALEACGLRFGRGCWHGVPPPFWGKVFD